MSSTCPVDQCPYGNGRKCLFCIVDKNGLVHCPNEKELAEFLKKKYLVKNVEEVVEDGKVSSNKTARVLSKNTV